MGDMDAHHAASQKRHIPSLLVVDQWASDVESSAHLDLLLLHSVWKMCGRRMSDKINSAISMA